MVLNIVMKSNESSRGNEYRTMSRRREIRSSIKEEEIPEKQTQRSTSQINRCGGINVQPRKDSRTIHQEIHKRNQTWFVQVLREITKQ